MAIEVKEIVNKWLIEHGYDGLVNDYGCGCDIHDLIPCCDDYCTTCEAATKTDCSTCAKQDECEQDDCKQPWVMLSGYQKCPSYKRRDGDGDGE